jgi:hypothetical protein
MRDTRPSTSARPTRVSGRLVKAPQGNVLKSASTETRNACDLDTAYLRISLIHFFGVLK